MRVASVIIDIATRALDKPFDYLVPVAMHALEVGSCVLVDFANRPAVGYVAAIREEAEDDDKGKLKLVRQVLAGPYFDAVSARVAEWIAREYVAPLPDAIRLFTPPGGTPRVRKTEGEDGEARWELVDKSTKPVDDRWARITDEGREYVPPRTAVKQKAVLDALREGEMRVVELSLQVGAVNATINALAKRGLVTVEKRRRIRGARPALPPEPEAFELTAGQAEALSAIEEARSRHNGSVVLCDGVTGSGKTEVYLRAIRRVVEEGGRAIVLVPEISLTPQTVARFRARFGERVAVLHSALSVGERFDQWDLARSGSVDVVIGARSALFAPLPDVRLIVIDEEHEGTYKQESSPRYHARSVAARMMRERGGVLVLGSATPSMETLQRCVSGRCARVELPERARNCELPKVTVVDLASEFGAGQRSAFSQKLTAAISHTLAEGHKAVLFLNQRGYARFLLCRECGFVPRCDDCSTSYIYHARQGAEAPSLKCHHCGAVQPVPVNCPRCGSPYIKYMGKGTQQIEQALRAQLGPEAVVIRMDADTTKTKGAHEKLLSEFAAADSAVLLGTQMIAKGLDFPDVTLVGVICADTTLDLPDFRSGERTWQLLEQVSGRAGRDKLPGEVIIQTYWPDHPAILAAAHHDRSIFLGPETAQRRELGYPPYARLANVLLWGKDDARVMEETIALLRVVKPAIDDKNAGLAVGVQAASTPRTGNASSIDGVATSATSRAGRWQVLGPSPCVISKSKGIYRWHLLIKAPIGSDVAGLIGPIMKARKVTSDVSVSVDIDPLDLF